MRGSQAVDAILYQLVPIKKRQRCDVWIRCRPNSATTGGPSLIIAAVSLCALDPVHHHHHDARQRAPSLTYRVYPGNRRNNVFNAAPGDMLGAVVYVPDKCP